jgi:hypothetical protein
VARPTVEDLASYLRGSWRIERDILDAAGAPVGRFTGWGRFDLDPEEPVLLRYREEGMLHLGAYAAPASRRLDYRVHGWRAEVRFVDGRPFHDLDLRDGSDTVQHTCGADLYRGRFEVVSDDSWCHEWSVTGPRKDHLIRTSYDRAC